MRCVNSNIHHFQLLPISTTFSLYLCYKLISTNLNKYSFFSKKNKNCKYFGLLKSKVLFGSSEGRRRKGFRGLEI